MNQKKLSILLIKAGLILAACTNRGTFATSQSTATPIGTITPAPTGTAETSDSIEPSPTASMTPSATTTSQPTASPTTEPADTPEADEQDVIPLFEQSSCRFAQPAWASPTCGFLTVPEDRSQTGGSVVTIHVAIFRSDNPNPRSDPVIYLTGGGGGNELDNIERYRSVITQVLPERDYIMYNQRGAKYGVPSLQCPRIDQFYSDLAGRDLSRAERETEMLRFAGQCAQQLRARGYDLNQYNSAVNAAHLNDLRIALGYELINI